MARPDFLSQRSPVTGSGFISPYSLLCLLPKESWFFPLSRALKLSAPVPPMRVASPLLPLSLQGMDALGGKAASDHGMKRLLDPPRSPGALEGKQHPSPCSELCDGESRPVHSSHICPSVAGEEISLCPFPPSQGHRELLVINVCQVLRDPQMESAMGGGRMINLLLLQFNAFPADSVPELSRG